MNAQSFLDQAKTEPTSINTTEDQRKYIQQIADNHNIPFEDAAMLLINHSLQHILKEMTDRFMNSN